MAELTSDPLDILLAHDAWATRSMLRVCERLSEEQFHHRFAIGLGSLHDNLAHTVAAMRRWADRVAGRPMREPIFPMPWAKSAGGGGPPPRFTVTELMNLHEEAAADLRGVAAAARARGLGSTLTMTWAPGGKGATATFTLGAALTHLCTHNNHHRAQCVNMLRQLGVEGLSDKLPDLSVMEWQMAVESPAVVS